MAWGMGMGMGPGAGSISAQINSKDQGLYKSVGIGRHMVLHAHSSCLVVK